MKLKLTSRKTTVLVAAGLMLAGTTSTALAANGDPLVIGILGNNATAATKLTANVAGSSLTIANNSTAANATPLDLRPAAGRPPMKVSNSTKVVNLNADQLDGLDSTAFLRPNGVRADGQHSSTSIDDFTGFNVPVASTSFSAPSAGFVMVSGSVSAEEDCSLTGRGNLVYNITVDGNAVMGTSYELGQWAECGVESGNIGGSGAMTAVVPVSSGSHTVSLVLSEFGSGSFINARSVTSVFLPSGSGSPVGSLTGKGAVTANKP